MKRIKSRILSGILALCLVAGLSLPAFATSGISASGGSAATPLNLTAAAASFDVVVPTGIALTINADATVTCPAASAVRITNNSAGAVKVSGISMSEGTWHLASYNGGNRALLAKEAVDAKKLGFQLSVAGDSAATTKAGNQTLTHDASKWVIEPGASLSITTAAIATAVSRAIETSETAASVVFTISWNTAA